VDSLVKTPHQHIVGAHEAKGEGVDVGEEVFMIP
jgi:hypothetical protein